MLAMLLSRRRDLRRRQLVGLPYWTGCISRARTYTATADVEAALDDVRGANLFTLRTGPLEAAVAELADGPRGRRPDPRCRTPSSSDVEEREPILVWQVGDAPLPRRCRRRSCSPGSARTPPAGVDGPAGRRRPAGGLGRTVRRAHDPDRSTSMPRRASPRSSRPTSAATRPPGSRPGHRRQRVRRRAPGRAAGARSSASTRRACARPTSSPARSACCAACCIGREPLVERVVLASETDGTYIPKPTPSPTKPTPDP